MSVFTDAEIAYLNEQGLGRLATIGSDGQPHIIPITFHYNADEDAIDIGGVDFASGKKWRDMHANQKVTFLVDDTRRDPPPPTARAIEIRGTAEPHGTGGSAINPRFPNFVEEFVRIRPTRIVAWGIDGEGYGPEGLKTNARTVDRTA
jgi:pyridoxamine 5'-phosphate oxidase family protein